MDENNLPLDRIIKRLDVLKNVILLNDIDDIEYNVNKLKAFDINSDIKEIIDFIVTKDYSSAISKIQSFISDNNQLLVWKDPEIEVLKIEIDSLENLLNSLDNELVELEKVISEFQNIHTKELGEIILEILKLRKIIFKNDQEKFEEAEQDEQEYQEQFDAESKKVIHELSEDQKKELKKNYRKASTLCHPDKFINEPPEIQNLANEIFMELNEANEQNDLKRANEILENLKNGILIRTEGNKIEDKKILESTILQLKNKVKTLEKQISDIKDSEEYATIEEIEDFDEYFRRIRSYSQ